MNSMARNLKHWMLYQLKTAGVTFLMIIGLTALFAFSNGGKFIDNFLKILPMYLGLMATFSIIVNGFTGISVIFPVTVSFGATRKHSIYAMVLAVHVIAIVEYGIAGAALLYTKPEFLELAKFLWPGFIALIAFVLALGNFIALLSNKFGRMAGMICYVVIVLLATIGVVVGISVVASKVDVSTAMVFPLAISTVAAIIMVVLDVISTYFLYRSIRVKDLTFVS